jgi:hypothetical protein
VKVDHNPSGPSKVLLDGHAKAAGEDGERLSRDIRNEPKVGMESHRYGKDDGWNQGRQGSEEDRNQVVRVR